MARRPAVPAVGRPCRPGGQCRLPVWYLHDPEFRLSTHSSTEQRAMMN